MKSSSGAQPSLHELFESLEWPDWYRDARCKRYPQDRFFGHEKAEDTSKHAADMTDEEVEAAKFVCGDCPVLEECREYALTNFLDYGVWGQMTHRDRLAWWRRYGGRRFLRNLEGFSGPFE